MNQVITCENAPAAVGTYSVAFKAGNTLYCSGQLGIDPSTGDCRILLKLKFVRLSEMFSQLLNLPAASLQTS